MARKMVPNKSGGVSRRSYQTAYKKGMGGKGVSGTMGTLSLKTPAPKTQKERVERSTRDYSKVNDPMNVSFGDTGYTEEDYS